MSGKRDKALRKLAQNQRKDADKFLRTMLSAMLRMKFRERAYWAWHILRGKRSAYYGSEEKKGG